MGELESTKEEWGEEMREHKKVTRRERRKKCERKELFKREMVEVRAKIEKIEETDEPE